jgi:hypothetical protein
MPYIAAKSICFAQHKFTQFVWMISLLVLAPSALSQAQVGIENICPANDIETRAPDYPAEGIILTTFDRASLWVYDVARDRRYPLPETFPCPANCRLSPDARWLVYFNDLTNSFNQMRLDGTQRSLVIEYATQVEWWSDDTWLIWTPGRSAYLASQADTTQREVLDVRGVLSVQPRGRWGLAVEPNGDGFHRAVLNLQDRTQRVDLGIDLNYYDDSAWSPDGSQLAYVAPVFDESADEPMGSELFLVSPADPTPRQLTRLTDVYGTARINGLAASTLSWSPDGGQIAFWVVDLGGTDPTTDGLEAQIHILNVQTRELTRYCRFTTRQHTPNPPRLVWSPDGTLIAFVGDIADDERPYLLLALDTASGIFTILSEGIYPALGVADVTAWGLPPS